MNASTNPHLTSPIHSFVWERDRRATASPTRVSAETESVPPAFLAAGIVARAAAHVERSFAFDFDAYYASERDEVPL